MNKTLKTVLLTILTLSAFTIAMIELSGVSTKAFFNKLKGKPIYDEQEHNEKIDAEKRDAMVQVMPATEFEFTDTKHDFGTITQGDKVKHTYNFKNTGKNPLMVSNVIVSCGCTAPFYSKEPIMPGDTGSITLEFNSAGKEGKVNKSALVKANTSNSPFSIGFSANVLDK